MAEKVGSWLQRLLFENWQRKSVSLILAMIIWSMVNSAITITITIPNVPIRVVNLPIDKTMEGLLPTGFLREGMTLTLKGTKTALARLEPGDVEIILDVSGKGDEWVGDITQKNLISLNPEVDLQHNVEKVIHTEFIVKLSNLVSEKIPIRISKPLGEPPQGYQFLDIWPQKFYHTVSGPEKLVQKLKETGLDLTFNLNEITKNDLDHLKSTFPGDDEIYYFVPSKWKRINTPFQKEGWTEINDPNVYNLHIIFLRNEFLPVDRNIPITLFFPYKHSTTINPDTYSLKVHDLISKQNGITVLNLPLYAGNVSRQFLDLVRDRLQIYVLAAPKTERETLAWSVQFINPSELEMHYIETLLPKDPEAKGLHPELHEQRLQERFRDYMRRLTLFTDDSRLLELDIKLQGSTIEVNGVASKDK